MADPSRSIPSIQAELGGMTASTLTHSLHPDGRLKRPGRALLGEAIEEKSVPAADQPQGLDGPVGRGSG